jgi:glutaredoxin-dependent peroxiredoxin
MDLRIGQPAPHFSLFDDAKNKVTLCQLKGKKVLLLFFPLAFTSTCTAELCAVRDTLSYYNGMNAQVYGISVDSLYTLAKFKEEQGINFPLLSDFNKEVSAAYGSLYPKFGFEMRGVSKRSAFLIDGEGRLQYVEILENAGEQPNFTAIKERLNEIT